MCMYVHVCTYSKNLWVDLAVDGQSAIVNFCFTLTSFGVNIQSANFFSAKHILGTSLANFLPQKFFTIWYMCVFVYVYTTVHCVWLYECVYMCSTCACVCCI